MLPDLGQRPFGDFPFTIPAIGEASCLRGFGFSMQESGRRQPVPLTIRRSSTLPPRVAAQAENWLGKQVRTARMSDRTVRVPRHCLVPVRASEAA
jgi:hypothetical protein